MVRRFSLKFAMVELTLLSVAFGLIHRGFIWGGTDRGVLCVVMALFTIGAALGGIFGSFRMGLALTILGILVGSLLMPA
jgi:hypothetical protein